MTKLRGIIGLSHPSADGENEQLLALINNMGDGFIAVDSTGEISLSNSAVLDILDTNSLTGKSISSALDIIDEKGYPIDLRRMILGSSSSFTNRDWRLRYKDGKTINLQVNVSPVRLGFGQKATGGFVLLIKDITHEKLLEQEREEFVSLASHELRTPVAIAEGSLSNARLLAGRTPTPEPIKHALEAAHDQIIFLSSLINDLAMLSRAERGSAAQTWETFAASDLLNSLVQDYQPLAARKQLVLQVQISEGLGLLTSSRLYVREILQNLITNSIKYTSKGSITLSAVAKDHGVEFSVSDTGFGIDKSEQLKLFSKFFRSEDWRVRENTGTGLGLYVSSKLAKLINGKITVKSELNRGSTFSILIPNMRAAQMPASR